MANSKQKANKLEIKVTAKNRPTKEQADIKLKQLGEFLSSGESPLTTRLTHCATNELSCPKPSD